MSNSCYGVMRVVTKDVKTFDRLLKIMNYKDDEYCLYRCKNCEMCEEPQFIDGLYVCDFLIDGAWTCEPFLDYKNKPEEKLIKKYDENNKPIYGTAHFTDLSYLAKELDFGAMFWTADPCMEFCERGLINHNGNYEFDKKYYSIHYPTDENGNFVYENAEEETGFGDEFKEWLFAEEIYGV